MMDAQSQIMPARDHDWVSWREGDYVYLDRVAYLHMKQAYVVPVPYALATGDRVAAVFTLQFQKSFRLLRADGAKEAADLVDARPYPTECDCEWVEPEDDFAPPLIWELTHELDCDVPRRDALEKKLERMNLKELQDTAKGCGAEPKNYKDDGYLIDAILAVEFPALHSSSQT